MNIEQFTNLQEGQTFRFTYNDDHENDCCDEANPTVGMLIAILQTYPPDSPISVDGDRLALVNNWGKGSGVAITSDGEEDRQEVIEFAMKINEGFDTNGLNPLDAAIQLAEMVTGR